MNCNEIFNVGIFYATDAYKRVCKFNEELHADIEKYRAENAKLRELVRDMFYAVHPADREKFLANVAELGVEV